MLTWLMALLLKISTFLSGNATLTWIGQQIGSTILEKLSKWTPQLLTNLKGNWRLVMISLILIVVSFLIGFRFHKETTVYVNETEIVNKFITVERHTFWMPPVNCRHRDVTPIAGLTMDEFIIVHVELVQWQLACENSLYTAEKRVQRINTGHGDQI